MKKIGILLVALCSAISGAHSQVLITGILDGGLSGGVPKLIELYVTEDIADLSTWSVTNYYNGNSSVNSSYTYNLSGSATAGSYLYLSYGTSIAITDYLGFTPTFSPSSNALNFNGDDAILLSNNGVGIDVYGVIGTDGTGQDWEYLDSWAYRVNGTSASTTFDIGDWSVAPVDTTDGTTTLAETGMPVGTFEPVPEPTTAVTLLGGLGAMFWAIRRRRVA